MILVQFIRDMTLSKCTIFITGVKPYLLTKSIAYQQTKLPALAEADYHTCTWRLHVCE